MKGIELLPISAESQKRLKEMSAQYRRFSRIYIEIISFSGNRIIVRAEQKELVNGRLLSKSELTNRVRELFKGEIPDDWKLIVSAVNYDRQDIENINADWIKKNMDKFDLKAKHLETYTGIDKATISSLLSGSKELTKWHKVALYYFFKYYELANFDTK